MPHNIVSSKSEKPRASGFQDHPHRFPIFRRSAAVARTRASMRCARVRVCVGVCDFGFLRVCVPVCACIGMLHVCASACARACTYISSFNPSSMLGRAAPSFSPSLSPPVSSPSAGDLCWCKDASAGRPGRGNRCEGGQTSRSARCPRCVPGRIPSVPTASGISFGLPDTAVSSWIRSGSEPTIEALSQIAPTVSLTDLAIHHIARPSQTHVRGAELRT